MSQPPDPQRGPVYGSEGAYATHRTGVPDRRAEEAAPSATSAPVEAPATPGPPGIAPPPPVHASSAPPAAPYSAGGPPRVGAGYLPRNDLAVWSLVLGLLGVMGCLFFTGVPAVVVGSNARRAVAAGQADNDGMATAGIVLGWVATALGVLVGVVLVLMTLLPLVFLGVAVPLMDGGR